MSLYWSPSEGRANRPARVRFRVCGSSTWRNGLEMPYHPISTDLTGEYNPLRPDRATYRGSLVHLQPDTEYIVELSLEGTGKVTHILASTRNENFPVGRVVNLRGQTINDTLELDSSYSGTASEPVILSMQSSEALRLEEQDNRESFSM